MDMPVVSRKVHRRSVAALIVAVNLLALAGLTRWYQVDWSFAEPYSAVAKDLLAQEVSPGQAPTSIGGAGSSEKAESGEGPSSNPGAMPTEEQGDPGDIKSRGGGFGPLVPLIPIPRLLPPPTQLNGAFACYRDQGDPQGTAGRDLSGAMSTDAAMTNGICRAGCASRGFAFAGTQVGTYCFCGNSFGKSGPATCTSSCAGNLGEICGGVWANSVSLSGAVPGSPPMPTPPSNGGQCVIDIHAQENISVVGGSTTTTYRHTEIQRWEVSGPAMQVPGVVGKVYTMLWSTTGNGDKDVTQRSTMPGGQTHTQRNLTVWNISGTAPTQLSVWFRQDIIPNIWVTKQVGTLPSSSSSVTDAQQKTIDGVIQPSSPPLTGAWSEFTGSFVNWIEAGTSTQITNKIQSFPVNMGSAPGYVQNPSTITGGTTCTWNLNLLLP